MTTATRTREQAQQGLWDLELDVPPAVEDLLAEHEASKDTARRYRQLAKALKRHLGALALEPFTRYRLGQFVITAAVLKGGGHDIPEWRTITYGIKAIDKGGSNNT